MAVGDVVSGFSGSFQPASGVSVIITFAGYGNTGGVIGITDGSSTGKVFVSELTRANYWNGSDNGLSLWKIPINNTNYFSGLDGYAGIQVA